jgi:hypothetical protein
VLGVHQMRHSGKKPRRHADAVRPGIVGVQHVRPERPETVGESGNAVQEATCPQGLDANAHLAGRPGQSAGLAEAHDASIETSRVRHSDEVEGDSLQPPDVHREEEVHDSDGLRPRRHDAW